MEPLLIAVDIVKFSLNRNAELKPAMEKFFSNIYEVKYDAYVPQILPTGDGAVLVWDWGLENEPDVLVPQSIIVNVLNCLKQWSLRYESQVRVGIHSDTIKYIHIQGNTSAFGHGISECVRYETAADSQQALISRIAKNHFKIPSSKAGISIGEVFHFFDKHGQKHTAYPVFPKNDGYWSQSISSSAGESMVRALPRQKEMPVNNNFLEIADSATIVAMTYKTLGAALASDKKSFQLNELRKAEICVFSLPILKRSHPTQKDAHLLENEWITGINQTIFGLLDENKCPKLEHLDLTILSMPPALTATVTNLKNEDGYQESILRYHPVLDGTEPEDSPTLIMNKTDEYGSPLFDAFHSMIENLAKKPPRLKFPLKRGSLYTLVGISNIEKFVKNLKNVCNNSEFECKDKLFNVKWHCSAESNDIVSLMPAEVSAKLDGHRKTNNLQVFGGPADPEVIISSYPNPSGPILQITNEHIMAFFVLMTWKSEVVLVDKFKSGWTHDVPGGKVSENDHSGHETIQREVFEELGLLLNKGRLGQPVGALYDPKSAKERGVPVIAQYYHYALDQQEFSYLFDVAKKTTKSEDLVPYELTTLLAQKKKNTEPIEAVCHASFAVVRQIVAQLNIT